VEVEGPEERRVRFNPPARCQGVGGRAFARSEAFGLPITRIVSTGIWALASADIEEIRFCPVPFVVSLQVGAVLYAVRTVAPFSATQRLLLLSDA